MSDRIAVMNRGRYEQLGDPETLYERPATAYVAGFLGVSNLLPATIGAREGEYVAAVLSDGAAVRIPAAVVDGKSGIRIGVRPEKIRLHTDATAIPDRMNRLAGRVIDASYLGASTSYIIESKAGQRLTVFEQNVERTSHGSLHRPGDDVLLSWSPDHTFAVGADGAAPIPASATA
jgi:spermidine/putrescine transport system ATP-binding protein